MIFGACYFLGGLVLTIEGVSVEISLDENGPLLPCFNWKVWRLVARVIELIPCSRVCDKKTLLNRNNVFYFLGTGLFAPTTGNPLLSSLT